MAMAAALLILFLAAPAAVYAAEHTVGGSSGWNTLVDYTTWAAGETFIVGDTLLFTYDTTHKVDVVNQADYTNCATNKVLNSYSGGSTTITLGTVGPMYFICPTSGHCAQGMKLAVNVLVANSTPPATPSPGSPPSPTTTTVTPPPPPPPPPPHSGVAGIFGNMNHLMLGLSLVLATVLAFMG